VTFAAATIGTSRVIAATFPSSARSAIWAPVSRADTAVTDSKRPVSTSAEVELSSRRFETSSATSPVDVPSLAWTMTGKTPAGCSPAACRSVVWI
jgi:hypothetical protein